MASIACASGRSWSRKRNLPQIPGPATQTSATSCSSVSAASQQTPGIAAVNEIPAAQGVKQTLVRPMIPPPARDSAE